MYNNLMNKKEIEFPKHSALIAMSNKVSAIQRKAFDGLIYLARKQLKTNPINYKYSVSAKILMGMIGVGENNYTYLNELLSKLHDIDVKYNITGKDKKHKWGMFSMLAGYNYEKGMITYSFPHQIQDAIIDPNIYAWIDMVVIKGLKSKYAIALYELAQDYANVDHPVTLKLDKFKELMGVETDIYKDSTSMFRERIINKAVNEINKNEKVKLSISYKLIKTGRRYTHIKFTVKPKPAKLKLKQQANKVIESEVKENPDLQELILLLPADLKNRKKIINIVLGSFEKKGKDYTKAQIEYVIERFNNGKIKNAEAYLKKAIEKDYASAEVVDLGNIVDDWKQKLVDMKKIYTLDGREYLMKAIQDCNEDGMCDVQFVSTENSENIEWARVPEKKLKDIAEKNIDKNK